MSMRQPADCWHLREGCRRWYFWPMLWPRCRRRGRPDRSPPCPTPPWRGSIRCGCQWANWSMLSEQPSRSPAPRRSSLIAGWRTISPPRDGPSRRVTGSTSPRFFPKRPTAEWRRHPVGSASAESRRCVGLRWRGNWCQRWKASPTLPQSPTGIPPSPSIDPGYAPPRPTMRMIATGRTMAPHRRRLSHWSAPAAWRAAGLEPRLPGLCRRSGLEMPPCSVPSWPRRFLRRAWAGA